MTPQPGDYSINLPITFDYRGGRNENKKNKILISIIDVFLTIALIVIMLINKELLVWQRILYACIVFYVGLAVLRFVVFKETYFSDIYEKLKKDDYELKLEYIWQIFDIDYSYPYMCYFKNGQKGIFVRMEKDAITGKPDTAMFDHYEAIGDAYNVAHALNMNIVHIDYMDNVGNDSRMQKMYDDLTFVENPDMQDMLIDIYSNLQEEMSRNYACFDIYLFLTRDNARNFVYNVQTVANKMLGGNFITYKVLDRFEISRVCTAVFNLHDFSIVEACENTLQGVSHSGIIPLNVVHGDGTVEEFNKTTEEKRIIAEENAKKQKEAEEEALRKRHEARHQKSASKKRQVETKHKVNTSATIKASSSSNTSQTSDEDVDLFAQNDSSTEDDDNIDLF